jgi:RNA polymerase sigma-70 factor (ECF subfamily)
LGNLLNAVARPASKSRISRGDRAGPAVAEGRGMDFIKNASADETSANDAMARYATGDDDAFAPLYRAVTPQLERVLRRLVADRSRLPDLIQETFLRVHGARRSFRAGAPAIPWILTIARRLVIDSHRRGNREEGVETDRLERLGDAAPGGLPPNGEELAVATEVAEHLGRAVERLPEGQRAALRLVRGEGLSVAEAAAALGTTTTGVKLRTHKACRTLRAALGTELLAAA